MVFGIREVVSCCANDAHEVQHDNECEELSVRVEPELEQNPATDLGLFWLFRNHLFDCSLGLVIGRLLSACSQIQIGHACAWCYTLVYRRDWA